MNILYSTRHRFFVHIIIYSIIICFLYENCVWAQGVQVTNPRSLTSVVSKLIPSLDKLTIPENFGKIENSFRGNSPKCIIHIRDSHVNYEAQVNYARILENLFSGQLPKTKKLIGVEGASGELTVLGFRSIPNEGIKKIVSNHFLKNGYLNGAEYFSIFSKEDVSLYGVEDPRLYRKNLSLFRKIQGIKKDLLPYIEILQQRLDSVVDNIFSDKIIEFFKGVQDYYVHKIGIVDYIELLNKYAGKYNVQLKDYPSLFALIRAIKLEKGINIKIMEKEREELIGSLESVLVKEELQKLVKNALLHRLGRVKAHEFYICLGEIIDNSGVDKEKYPNLIRYIRLCSIYQYIGAERPFKEIEKLEEELKKKLFTKEIEWKVDKLYTYLRIVKGLLQLQLTREELEFYKRNRSSIGLVNLGAELNTLLAKYSKAIVSIPDFGGMELDIFESFYDTALERDNSIVENMLKKMDEDNVDIGILVTGGFHTAGIKEKLFSKGISYTIISPNITEIHSNDLYINLMMGHKTPFEKLLMHTGKRIPPPCSVTVPDGGVYLGDRDLRERLLRLLTELVIDLHGYKNGRKGGKELERFITNWKKKAGDLVKGDVEAGLEEGIFWHSFTVEGRKFYSVLGVEKGAQEIQERLGGRDDVSKEEVEIEGGKKLTVWFMPEGVFNELKIGVDRKVQEVKESLKEILQRLSPENLNKMFNGAIPDAPAEIKSVLIENIRKPLEKFFGALESVEGKKAPEYIFRQTIYHYICLFTSLVQLVKKVSYTDDSKNYQQLLRLCEGSTRERFERNFVDLLRLYNDEYLKWVIIILFHDIGKFKDPANEALESVNLISKYGLFETVDSWIKGMDAKPFSEDTAQRILLTVKYHPHIGMMGSAQYTIKIISEVLNDEIIRKTISENPDKKGEIVKDILNDIVLVSALDTASATQKDVFDPGFLRAPLFELYTNIVARVTMGKDKDFMDVLNMQAWYLALARLGIGISMYDDNLTMNIRESNNIYERYSYYIDKISKAREKAVELGIINEEDWNKILVFLSNQETMGWVDIFVRLAWMNKEWDSFGRMYSISKDDEINIDMFRFLKFTIDLREYFKDRAIYKMIVYAEPQVWLNRAKDQVGILSRFMKNIKRFSKVVQSEKEDRHYLAEADGTFIAGPSIEIIDNNLVLVLEDKNTDTVPQEYTKRMSEILSGDKPLAWKVSCGANVTLDRDELPIIFEAKVYEEEQSLDIQANPQHQEAIYVIEGRIRVKVVDKEQVVSAGELISTFGSYSAEIEPGTRLVRVIQKDEAGLTADLKSDEFLKMLSEDVKARVRWQRDSNGDMQFVYLPKDLSSKILAVLSDISYRIGIGFKDLELGLKGRIHRHPVDKPEILIVVRGRLKYLVYSLEGKFVEERILNAGDMVVCVSPHNVESLSSDTRVVEVPIGPFSLKERWNYYDLMGAKKYIAGKLGDRFNEKKLEEVWQSIGIRPEDVVGEDRLNSEIIPSTTIVNPFGVKSVVYVSPEVAPFSKKGGLADVAKEYPPVLAEFGIDTIVVTMLYREKRDKVMAEFNINDTNLELKFRIGHEEVNAKVYKTKVGKVTYYFLENDRFTDALYGDKNQKEKVERAVFFSRGTFELLKVLRLSPDIIQSNDWMAALVPILKRTDGDYSNNSLFANTKTMHTLHNVGRAYQGMTGYVDNGVNLFELLNIDAKHCDGIRDTLNIDEMNFTAGAIRHSDLITTVSETYSKELMQPEFGEGLDGLLREKEGGFFGIVNGVEVKDWREKYAEIASSKSEAKEKLQKEMGLEVDPEKPIIGIVSRLTEQKGLGLLLDKIRDILRELDVQFVLLGTAEPGDSTGKWYEGEFEKLNQEFPERVKVNIMFDAKMADRIYYGVDMFLVPSRYEPCGLTQQFAMIAGTIPIVRATGGLEDTVQEYDLETGSGNGFKFKEFNSDALYDAIKRAVDLYRNKPDEWARLVQSARGTDVNWKRSALRYIGCYRKALGLPDLIVSRRGKEVSILAWRIIKDLETVLDNVDLPIVVEKEKYKERRIISVEADPKHQEAIYVIEGRICIKVADNEQIVEAGELVSTFGSYTAEIEPGARIIRVIQKDEAGLTADLKSDEFLKMLSEDVKASVRWQRDSNGDMQFVYLPKDLSSKILAVLSDISYRIGIGFKDLELGLKGRIHKHPVDKPEILIVARGRLKYIVYSPEGRFVEERILNAGDMVVCVSPHNVESLSDDTRVVEFPVGPFSLTERWNYYDLSGAKKYVAQKLGHEYGEAKLEQIWKSQGLRPEDALSEDELNRKIVDSNLDACGFTEEEKQQLISYSLDFFEKYKDLFKSSYWDLLLSVSDPDSLVLNLRARGEDYRDYEGEERDKRQRIYHEYAKIHRDFINNMPEILRNKLYTQKMLYGNASAYLIDFMKQVQDEGESVSGEIRLISVRDLSSGRGIDIGRIVNRFTLECRGRQVTIYLKGAGKKYAQQRGKNHDYYEEFYYNLLKLLGLPSIFIRYYPIEGDSYLNGFNLMQEIPAVDFREILDIDLEGKVTLKDEYQDKDGLILTQLAQHAACADLVQKSDRTVIQRLSQYGSNYMINIDKLSIGEVEIYSIDQDWVFGDGEDYLLKNIAEHGSAEICFLLALPGFWRDKGRFIEDYKKSYLAMWGRITQRKEEILKMVADYFGEDSREYGICKERLDSDPNKLLDKCINALYSFIASSYIGIGECKEVNPGVEVAGVVFDNGERFAKGRAVRIEPNEIDLRIWYSPEAQGYDFSKYAQTPELAEKFGKVFREFPGKTIKQFIEDDISGDYLFAVNGHQANFWAANTLLIVNGKIIAKTATPIRHDTCKPLSGTYYFFILDKGRIEIRIVHLKSGVPVEDISDIQYAIAGPPLIMESEIRSDLIKQNPATIDGNQVTWGPLKDTFAFSGIGVDKEGKVIQASMAGDPNEKPEVYLAEIAQVMKQLGCVDAVLLGTSADTQQYIRGDEDGYLVAEPRRGTDTGKYYESIGGRPLGSIIFGLPRQRQISDASKHIYPDGDEIASEKLKEGREKYWDGSERQALESVLHLIKPGSVIIDAGAGEGRLLGVLVSTKPKKIIFIETDRSRLEKARRIAEELGISDIVDFRLQSLSKQLELTEKADAVICSYVLNHISSEYVNLVLNNLKESLNPSTGLLILLNAYSGTGVDTYNKTIVGEDKFESSEISDAEFGEIQRSHPEGVLSVHRFTIKTLKGLLEKYGFCVDKTWIFHYYTWGYSEPDKDLEEEERINDTLTDDGKDNIGEHGDVLIVASLSNAVGKRKVKSGGEIQKLYNTIIQSDNVADEIKKMAESGELWKVFPELKVLRDVPGGSSPKYAGMSAWRHTEKVLEMIQAIANGDREAFHKGAQEEITEDRFNRLVELYYRIIHNKKGEVDKQKKLLLWTLALLHDIGKQSADRLAEHAFVGAEMIGSILERLGWFSIEEIEIAKKFIQYHAAIGDLFAGEICPVSIMGVDLDILKLINIADIRSVGEGGFLRNDIIDFAFEVIDKDKLIELSKNWDIERIERLLKDPQGRLTPEREGRIGKVKQLIDALPNKEGFKEFLKRADIFGYYLLTYLDAEQLVNLLYILYRLKILIGDRIVLTAKQDEEIARVIDNLLGGIDTGRILGEFDKKGDLIKNDLEKGNEVNIFGIAFYTTERGELVIVVPEEKAPCDLKTRIINRIQENNGKIPYAEFMKLTLYDPEFGYYSAGLVAFSRAETNGKVFATDAMQPEFAVGLAKQFYVMWEQMGKPAQFDIVEMGAGDGTLCLNILNEIKEQIPDFYNAVKYTIVEISPALVKRQEEKILPQHKNVNWKIQSASEEMSGENKITGVFISNELVDEFIAHRVIYDEKANKLQEIYVGYDPAKGGFYEIVDDISSERITDYMQVIYDQTGKRLIPGKEAAVCLEMVDWIRNVAKALNKGFVITFDYGHIDWIGFLNGNPPSVYSYGLLGVAPLVLGVDITHDVDFQSLDWYGQGVGLKREWLGDVNNYISRFSDMKRISRSWVLIQSKNISERKDTLQVVKEVLGYLKKIGLQKDSLPGIPLEGDMSVNDILDSLIITANESESSAEEALINLIAKGDRLEGYVGQAIYSIDIDEAMRARLEVLIDRAKAIKNAEREALSILEKISIKVSIGIIDAHALVDMRESEARQVLSMLTQDPNKAIAVVVFDKEDEGIFRVVDASKVTVVKADEFDGRLPEEAAIEKVKRERFGGKEVEISDVSILASLENIIKGRWRLALSNFHYVILNNKSLTITALLNMYQELPQDVKAYLAQAGLNVEVIKRSSIQEERFEPENYKKNAITEIAA